jgi:hypothetical protein
MVAMRIKRKTREKYQDRDARIRQMQEDGASNKEITLAVGISRKTLSLVFDKFEAERLAKERSAQLLQDIRWEDDLDRKWKVKELMNTLLLPIRARTSLGYRWEWNEVTELSLREFMELVISDKPHPKPGFLLTPLVDFRNVRLKTFWETVKRLTELDLGDRCNQEWKRRLERLKQAQRIHGGQRYSWSKPCEHPEWLLKEPRKTAPTLQMEPETRLLQCESYCC